MTTEEIKDKLSVSIGSPVESDVPLKNHVSLKVGGPAQYFVTVKNVDQLVKAVTSAYELKVPYIVLGGGYNVLPSDKGYKGLVICNQSSNMAFAEGNSQIIVDSGVPISKIINTAAGRGLGGLEFLFGIPGTIGGAVYGNAGAFSYEIGDFVKSVIMLAPRAGEMAVLKKDAPWMEFSYRSSKLKSDFKQETFKPVILTVKLQLVKRRRDEIIGLMQANLKKKMASQPLRETSAGSFFKNAGTTPEKTAGYMLDQSGAKKMRVGGAAVSGMHANFLINRKNASAEDIKNLASNLKDKVSDKFNTILEEEIEYIGEW